MTASEYREALRASGVNADQVEPLVKAAIDKGSIEDDSIPAARINAAVEALAKGADDAEDVVDVDLTGMDMGPGYEAMQKGQLDPGTRHMLLKGSLSAIAETADAAMETLRAGQQATLEQQRETIEVMEAMAKGLTQMEARMGLLADQYEAMQKAGAGRPRGLREPIPHPGEAAAGKSGWGGMGGGGSDRKVDAGALVERCKERMAKGGLDDTAMDALHTAVSMIDSGVAAEEAVEAWGLGNHVEIPYAE